MALPDSGRRVGRLASALLFIFPASLRHVSGITGWKIAICRVRHAVNDLLVNYVCGTLSSDTITMAGGAFTCGGRFSDKPSGHRRTPAYSIR